jgi:hypothetical protein
MVRSRRRGIRARRIGLPGLTPDPLDRRLQTAAAAPEGNDIDVLMIIGGNPEPVVMTRSVAASLAQVLVRALAHSN